jgi:hypothetical protein
MEQGAQARTVVRNRVLLALVLAAAAAALGLAFVSVAPNRLVSARRRCTRGRPAAANGCGPRRAARVAVCTGRA